MGTPRTYFLGSRLWWAAVLLAVPLIGVLTADVVGTVGVALLLGLPGFVLFDGNRPWWSDDVRRLPEDRERWRVELRKLTLSSFAALVVGLATALLLTLR